MKVLLDHCVPRPFERLLPGHEATHTSRLGWGHLSNGALLSAAEGGGFGAIVTVDQNLPFQQEVSDRKLGLVVIRAKSNDIPSLLPLAGLVMVALLTLQPVQTITVGE